jgi:ADP-ribosylglycohydrolase
MGNGASMRVAPLGAYFADDLDAAVSAAEASAEVTHAHPEGKAGAIAVAVAAATAWRFRECTDGSASYELLRAALKHTPLGRTREGIVMASKLARDAPIERAVECLGNGSRVTAPDTVPFCLWCAARHLDNYVDAMWATVAGLGDRDTTCAIVGGIVVLATGTQAIPVGWLRTREALSLDD